jgi:hypothetical protein
MPRSADLSDTTAISYPTPPLRLLLLHRQQRLLLSDDPTTLQMNEARDYALAASNPAQLIGNTTCFCQGMSPFMRSVLVARLSALTTGDLALI